MNFGILQMPTIIMRKGYLLNIKKSLDQLKYQGQSVGDYTAGYMWGTLGYVYNPKYVSREDAEDWDYY